MTFNVSIAAVRELNFLPGIIRLFCDVLIYRSQKESLSLSLFVPAHQHLEMVKIYCLVHGRLARHFNFTRDQSLDPSGFRMVSI